VDGEGAAELVAHDSPEKNVGAENTAARIRTGLDVPAGAVPVQQEGGLLS
jgi:hypothetical protein